MNEAASVLVLDVGTPEALTTVLRQVLATVPLDTEVRYVSRGRTALPARLARRVRRVSSGASTSVQDVIRTLADGSRRLVVLRPEVRLENGWWEALERDSATAPNACLTLGADAMLLAFPCGLPADRVRQLPWSTPTGVRVPAAAQVGAPATHRSLGAVLIVKDEKAVLGECLSALTPFVDEVLVYDTGSSDGSQDIARSLGAAVVQGFWDDDFAAARNRALTHARTDWVLSIDADEILTGDVAEFRRAVDACRDEAMCIDITSGSVEGGGHEVTSSAVRLFHRPGTTWTASLHEYPVGPGERRLRVGPVAPVRIAHSGYETTTFLAKDKHARNLAIARAAVDRLSAGNATAAAAAWTSLGRACTAASLWTEALEALSHVPTDVAADENLLASRAGAMAALLTGQTALATTWVDRLATGGEASARVQVLRAEIAYREGDEAAARAHLDRLSPSQDLWGVSYDLDEADPLRFQLARKQGGDAARRILVDALDRGSAHVRLEFVLTTEALAPGTLDDVARTAPDSFLARALRESVQTPPAEADAWLEALHAAGRGGLGVLSAASVIAPRLPLERVLTWSLRLREAGLVEACPLRRIAEDEDADLTLRVSTLAVLAGPLNDDKARAALLEVVEDLSPDLLSLVGEYAPELLPGGFVGVAR